jgi:DNA-binding CsgD family transcriptional regulator
MPFQWRPLLDQQAVDAAALTVFDEAAEFDILDGLTIPIHGADGFAMMSMVINDGKLFTTAGLPMRNSLHMMALYYHDTVERRAAEAMAAGADIRLSPREREVLIWSARGKSSWEISQVLKLSERTVTFHMENAKAKLGVTSRSHATVKAIMLGLISP